VPHDDGSQRAAPDKKTRAELGCVCDACARRRGGPKASSKKRQLGQESELDPVLSPFKQGIERITHDVFCVAFRHRARPHVGGARQQPAEMGPKEALQRRVRILLFIGEMVVTTMDCDPEGWRELQTTRSKDGKGVLKPQRTRKAAMRDEPMETKIDSKNAEHIHSDGKSDDPGPAKQPGKNANDASPWQRINPTRLSVFNFIAFLFIDPAV
jgi:hypothetical protein